MSSYGAPFTTDLLRSESSADDPAESDIDSFPASYQNSGRKVKKPTDNLTEFLKTELVPSKLDPFGKHMWAIGGKHAAAPLNCQIAFGREIVLWEDVNLHLVWNSSSKIFIKPLPRYLLDKTFWQEQLSCVSKCSCDADLRLPDAIRRSSPAPPGAECLQKQLRRCALGFLYTYVCLIAYESDFAIAQEKHLLPLLNPSKNSQIKWDDWKRFSRQVLSQHSSKNVHPRFLRGELRLSRLNFFSRFTQFPLFTSYVRGWRGYGSLVRDNVTWLLTATVFVALVLTALQVGLATNQLKDNDAFMQFSYGFSIFAIVASVGAFIFIIVEVVYNIVKDNLRRSEQADLLNEALTSRGGRIKVKANTGSAQIPVASSSAPPTNQGMGSVVVV
ncbi:hypothetical protein F4818DRAFT_442550 [Hypoxylon cercidicola]|nr:hypothetical protein F4818DRAFT_442550 [Hypoxylon cercidicola]